MHPEYIIFDALYTSSWGGCTYERGTPRGVMLALQHNGVDYLFAKTFGAGCDVYVGAEATQRRGVGNARGPERVFASADELNAALPVALQGLAGYHQSNPFYFDGVIMTPELLIERGGRVLRGLSPRLED